MATWPDPQRPGVPLNPERDGWHWLVYAGKSVEPDRWNAEVQGWRYAGALEYTSGTRVWSYLGPCLLPSEVAAREAAARAEEREACAADVDCGCAARPDVLARLADAGERKARNLCPHGDVCCALQAAAIRARGGSDAG